ITGNRSAREKTQYSTPRNLVLKTPNSGIKRNEIRRIMRDPTSIWKQLIEYIFYGNFFYGICAVALMLETNVQLDLDVRDPAPYGMAFLATVMFYNYPYARINTKAATRTITVSDPRTLWYRRNATLIRKTRVIVTITLCVLVVFFLIRQWGRIVAVPTSGW